MKKHKLIITAALSMALAGCSSPAATSSPNDSASVESLKAQVESLSNENESLKAQVNESETAESVKETKADKKAAAGTILSIGDEGTLGDWGVTVTNAQIVDSISDNKYTGFKPEDGSKYLLIDITIANNGKTAGSFLPSYGFGDDVSAKITYQGDYEFSATNLLGYSKDIHDATLNPLSNKSGSVAFEIPDNVAASTDELILTFQSGNKKLNFKVR